MIWDLELSSKWKAMAEKDQKDYKNRGDKIVEKSNKNVETGGFEEILMLDYKESTIMAVVGTYDKSKHGPYEIGRKRRADFYKNAFNREEVERVEMKETELVLGDIPVVNYHITAQFEKMPIINKTYIIHHRIYEGKINEKEFILISTQSKNEKIDAELVQMILDSKIHKSI
jgi:hypothetical protein